MSDLVRKCDGCGAVIPVCYQHGYKCEFCGKEYSAASNEWLRELEEHEKKQRKINLEKADELERMKNEAIRQVRENLSLEIKAINNE